MTAVKDSYFKLAEGFNESSYYAIVASRNRMRLALLGAFACVFLLILCMLVMLPLQHNEILIMHHRDHGVVWMEKLADATEHAITQSQVESDIVRYVVNRESYLPGNYAHQYHQIILMSGHDVGSSYQSSQDAKNPKSLIHTLGRHVTRSVTVHNVLWLNKKKKRAQVNYTVTDHNHTTQHDRVHDYIALIAWEYRGLPANPSDRWDNADGFLVTQYVVQQTNL
jgi:type IV secretion system protein VirB8